MPGFWVVNSKPHGLSDARRSAESAPNIFTLDSDSHHSEEKFHFEFTHRRHSSAIHWMTLLSSIFGVAPLSNSIDGSYLLFDGCMQSSCVCGWTNAAEGAAFLFSYLFLATAMIRRDNAFSISINSAWRPTSTSSTDGFGRAKL